MCGSFRRSAGPAPARPPVRSALGRLNDLDPAPAFGLPFRMRSSRSEATSVKPIISLLTVVVVTVIATPVRAGLLTGRVEYNSATHLYDYTYTLDNAGGPWPITEVSVLIAHGRAALDLRPPAWSAPPGWAFGTSVSGGIENPPYNEFGVFWFWYNADGLPVGARAEFTFASSHGPGGAGNNYFLFAPEATRTGDGVAEYGRTAAPVVTPEPATATLCGCALGLLGVVGGTARRVRRVGSSR